MSIPAETPVSTGSSFVLMGRVYSPNTGGSAHQAISFNGFSNEAYGGFVASNDMRLKNFTYRCTTTVTTISFYIRINGGSYTLLDTYSGAATSRVTVELNINIASGDLIELTYVSGTNTNDDIGVSYYFEAQAGKTLESFFTTLYRDNLERTDRILFFGEAAQTTPENFPLAAQAFIIRNAYYYCKSGNAVQDHTIKFSLNGVSTTVGTLTAGNGSVLLSGLDYLVGFGEYFGVLVNATGNNGDDGVIVLECERYEESPNRFLACSGTNSFTGGTNRLKGNIFRALRDRVLTGVEVGFYVGGFDVTLKIYEVDASKAIIAELYTQSLGSSPSSIQDVTLTTPLDLAEGKYYAICLTRDAAGTFNFRADTTPLSWNRAGYFTYVSAAENSSNAPAVSASLAPAVSYAFWFNPITETPPSQTYLDNNKSSLSFGATDLNSPQTIWEGRAPCDGYFDFVSFAADTTHAASLFLEIAGGGAVEILAYSITADGMANAPLDYLPFSQGDLIKLTHSGSGSAGVGGTATLGFFMGTPPSDPEPEPPTPNAPPDFNGGLWPSELPTGTATASGGVASNKISFETEVGPPIDRRRSSFATRTITVELPPLTQEQYETFLTFFNVNKIGEFTFPDPMTKEDKHFKFRKGREPFNQTRLTSGLMRVSFELIRVD